MLQIGSNAELVCLAIANDINRLEYVFRAADSGDLEDNMSGGETTTSTNIDDRHTLFINEVKEENAGNYNCLVRDFVGGTSNLLDEVPFTISVFGEYTYQMQFENPYVYSVNLNMCHSRGGWSRIISL